MHPATVAPTDGNGQKKIVCVAGGMYCAQLRQSMGAFVVFVQAVKQRILNKDESTSAIFPASYKPRLRL